MRRFAIITRVKPGKLSQYTRLHDEIWETVVKAGHEAGLRNYSIFEAGEYLFSYYEYVGDDYDADMLTKNALPVIQSWQRATGECLEDINGQKSVFLKEVFHNDF